MVCGRPVTVALLLMYHSFSCGGGSDRTQVCRDFHQPPTQVLKPSGALMLWMGILPCHSVCVMSGEVWLVLSRSRPSTHFLSGGHYDSRVKFLWYPQISAACKCQFSGISPLSFDTLVSVMTPVRPCWPFVHLDITPSTLTHTHAHAHSKTHDVLYWYPASHLNRKFVRVTDCILVFSLTWPYVSTLLTFTNEVLTIAAAHIYHYNFNTEMPRALMKL